MKECSETCKTNERGLVSVVVTDAASPGQSQCCCMRASCGQPAVTADEHIGLLQMPHVIAAIVISAVVRVAKGRGSLRHDRTLSNRFIIKLQYLYNLRGTKNHIMIVS